MPASGGRQAKHFETLPKSLDLLFFPFSPEKKGNKKEWNEKVGAAAWLAQPMPV